MSKGVIFKIYKLDRSKIEGLGNDLINVPDTLVKKYNEQKEAETYEQIPQTNQPNNDFVVKFYRKSDINRIQHKWKQFFEASGFSLGNPGTELHHIACFMYQKATKDIYVVSTGHAYVLFEHYIDYIFPLEVARRIAKAEIKAAETKAISGYLQASNLFFRTPRRIAMVEALDNVWTKLFGSIRDNTLSSDKFKEIFGEKSKASLSIKTSIDINAPVADFNSLVDLVTWLGTVPVQPVPEDSGLDFMDTIRPLDPRKAKLDIERLDVKLADDLRANSDDYDLCNEEHSRYLNAGKYIISKGRKTILTAETPPSISEAIEAITANEEGGQVNIDTLKKYGLQSLFPDEPYLSMEDTLYHHICGELAESGKNYFLLNGRWFLVSDDFIRIISDDFGAIAQDSALRSAIELRAWSRNMATEGDYNLSYDGRQSYIVGDKVFVENTELCDLLQWDETVLRIVHVKKGFNVKVRDVASQLSNAAHIIENDLRTTQKTRLKMLYTKLKDLNRVPNLSQAQFLDTFSKYREYVLAYAEPENRLEDPTLIRSNIAKYELVNLQNEMLRYSGKVQLKLKWIKYDSQH